MTTAADTFDDLPPAASNPLWVSELMFSGLRTFVGPVITGLASPIFASDCDWGRAIQLSDDESLQVRIYPRGVVSSGRLAEASNLTIMVAARRTQAGIGKDTVSLAILWSPVSPDQELRYSAFDFLRATAQPVAARNLHIALPSLFNHHDAQFGGAPDDAKPKTKWPILDDGNFHAVRPGSFSVHRAIKLGNEQRAFSVCAAPGVSQFVIAGNIGGVDIDDASHMATEPIGHRQWDELISKYKSQLHHADRRPRRISGDEQRDVRRGPTHGGGHAGHPGPRLLARRDARHAPQSGGVSADDRVRGEDCVLPVEVQFGRRHRRRRAREQRADRAV